MSCETYPLVFLSHKHVDREIARVLAEFLSDESRCAIDIHNSSGEGYLHPDTGDRLTDALRAVLWKTHVLILLYTSPEHDWSWCMWEAGVANDSQSPDTRIVVFQCMDQAPSLFAGQLHVNVRKLEDIRSFVNSFFLKAEFFPGLGRALTPRWSEEGVRRAADRLFDALHKVLPDPASNGDVNVWPVAKVRMVAKEAEMARTNPDPRAREIVSQSAHVASASEWAAKLFGRATISGMTFADLRNHWAHEAPGEDNAWHDSCCNQIITVMRGDTPLVPQTPIRATGVNTDYVPNLIRHRKLPYCNDYEFDFVFVDVSNPQAIPVADRMLDFDQFFFRNVDEIDAKALKLVDFIGQIEGHGYNRIPLLNGKNEVVCIVHRSMIDRYLVSRRNEMNSLTLADLIEDREIGRIVRECIAFVPRRATVADARRALNAIPDCLDVFITENGSRTEPVLGWLTNVDMRRRRGNSKATTA